MTDAYGDIDMSFLDENTFSDLPELEDMTVLSEATTVVEPIYYDSPQPPPPPPPQRPIHDFSQYNPNICPCTINTYFKKYKDFLIEQMTETVDTNEHEYNHYAVEYCKLAMDVYGYDMTPMLENLAEHNYVPAIFKLIEYYYINDFDHKCMDYMSKLPNLGHTANCSYPFYIYRNHKNNENDIKLKRQIDTYYQELSQMYISPETCEYIMAYNIECGNYRNAKRIYYEAKQKIELEPIDLSQFTEMDLTNQVIYGNENPFSKDDITHKYINKLNPPWGKQFGTCNICMTEKTQLLPFDCTHQVCADNCYPHLYREDNCPICKMEL